MFRKIGLVFVIASLFLSMVVGNSSADWWRPLHFSDGWYALRKVPLPQGYEKYWWIGGCDFADVHKRVMLDMKIWRWVGNTSLSALISYIVGWGLGGGTVAGAATGALTEEAKKKAAEAAAAQALKSAGGGAFLGNLANLFGYNLAELFVPYTIDDLNKNIEFLRSELGISDYYVFGRATRPQGPEGQGGSVTLALGAQMNLRMGSPLGDYFGMGYPRELRVITEDWPRVLRWKTPELDFGKIDSRVWERGITGELRRSTVQRVFAYEVVDGKKIPYTTEGKPSRLPVQPDTPEKGGKIVGKVRLRYLKKLRETGLREVHVCSPVNEGAWAKKLDDYAFAIVINTTTVSATPSKKELKVGDELVVAVEVKGFHPAKGSIGGSDGKAYPWKKWAGAILRGASLEAPGITETELVHERERTLLKATVKEPGKVKAVLQTRDGPVEWEVATVEKEVKPEEVVEEVVEEEKERARITATIQEVVKTPFGWYYQVVIGVEGVRVSFTGREDWERYPDETRHHRGHWKSLWIQEAGEKRVLAVEVVRFDNRPAHDLIEHRIVWYGVDENHNEIELESVFSPSETGYKDSSK